MSAPPVSCAWAPWWSPEQLRDFLNHVESVVQARFGEHTVDEAEGTVTVENMDCVLGLSNLAQTCRAADPEDWRLIIYSHIARLDDFAPDLLAERLSDYAQLQPDLRVRVVGDQHVSQIDAVCDPLPLGLSACLSVDLDGAACPVDRSYFSEWGVEQAEVMAAALANTLMDEPLSPLEGDACARTIPDSHRRHPVRYRTPARLCPHGARRRRYGCGGNRARGPHSHGLPRRAQ